MTLNKDKIMTTKKEVDELFLGILAKSNIKRVSDAGFDKYIIYNDCGTLFVVGFNSKTCKHGFGRTPLMLQEYQKAGLSDTVLPDYKTLYVHIACIHSKYRDLEAKIKPIFDFIDMFCGKSK